MNKHFAQYFDVFPHNIFLFSKGRVALYTLLKSLGIGQGDEVIMSGYTCVMVPSAPIYLGATCRYIDIDPNTYNLNPELLDRAYTAQTKALIVQHTYGIAQDMEPIMKWAASKGIPIIEDCCHAFGSKNRGRLCGTFGVGAFFSGQWNKPFSTGLGGMLLVNDESLVPAVNRLYTNAIKPGKKEERLLSLQIKAYRTFVTPRTTAAITIAYRMLTRLGLVRGSSSNEEFAGIMPRDYFKKMANCQIKEGERNLQGIDALVGNRKKITEFYTNNLPCIGLKPLKENPFSDDVILRYPVRVENKSEILKKALQKGVEVGSWFEIPLHPEGVNMEYFGYKQGMCPESEKACSEVINLPTHRRITLSEADRVLSFVKKYRV